VDVGCEGVEQSAEAQQEAQEKLAGSLLAAWSQETLEGGSLHSRAQQQACEWDVFFWMFILADVKRAATVRPAAQEVRLHPRWYTTLYRTPPVQWVSSSYKCQQSYISHHTWDFQSSYFQMISL
jgi:hypothetical protein